MTLHEAVLQALKQGHKWLAIDANLSIYSYPYKPKLRYDLWDVNNVSNPKKHIFIGECDTPLGGSYMDWLLN